MVAFDDEHVERLERDLEALERGADSMERQYERQVERLNGQVADLREELRRVAELLEAVPVDGEGRDLLAVVAEAARRARLWKDWHNEAERRSAEAEELRLKLAQASTAHEVDVAALQHGVAEWKKLAEKRGQDMTELREQIAALSRSRVRPRDVNAGA